MEDFDYPCQKEGFIRLPLLIINEGKICGISSTRRFDSKMFVQVSILFQISDQLFRVNRVPMNFSRSLFRNCIFVLFLVNWFKYKPFRPTLDEDLHLILLSFFIVWIQVLNSRICHFVFLGARARFQAFFVKKLCFSVLVLNSIKAKDSKFISGEQFHLIVPASFPSRLRV